MSPSPFDKAKTAIVRFVIATLGVVGLASAGCGTPFGDPPTTDGAVVASIINVTPYEVSVLVSGVLDDSVDTVEETVSPSDSTDVSFVCIDELVIGDPLEPEAAGVAIDMDGQPAEIAPFSIRSGESFQCGDILEIIVSGADRETFAVDVFALTPP